MAGILEGVGKSNVFFGEGLLMVLERGTDWWWRRSGRSWCLGWRRMVIGVLEDT